MIRLHRCDEREWAQLIATGKAVLIEWAAWGRTASYGEFNAELRRRTGSAFDLSVTGERAAVGRLLEGISEAAFEETGGRLLGALVRALGADDAGAGFYSLARRKGLPVPRTPGGRQLFWARHVRELHEFHAQAGAAARRA